MQIVTGKAWVWLNQRKKPRWDRKVTDTVQLSAGGGGTFPCSLVRHIPPISLIRFNALANPL